ncbi:MAG: alanine--tRNA ligase [Clostridia bacterium]|nr:alanine--tRNA ligase [Clostridia bacterium]
MTTKLLKEKFIKFFKEKNHVQIDSASLVPDNDGSVLFTTAGMHPLVPYLLGKEHPQGRRLCDYQKCVRTNDIDSVGDDSHLTFFEMLGSWSLGDYFKNEIIGYSYEFLTSKDYLNLPVDRLAVSVFAGNENSPKDEETYARWKELGIKEENIYYLGKKENGKENNWWELGEVGPCGPDSEMFYITDKKPCGKNCSPACDCGRFLEIWNDVFMGFVRKEEGKPIVPLKDKNVDTGMGLERTVCVLNGYKSVYEVDSLRPAIEILEKLSGKSYNVVEEDTKAMRIIADHLRTSTMVMGDEIATTPSNVGRGYVLRRLIRRSINFARRLNINPFDLEEVVNFYLDFFKADYTCLQNNADFVREEFRKEVKKFNNTITQGLKEFDKVVSDMTDVKINGAVAFRLYDTFGFPLELTCELAKEKGLEVNVEEYNECYKNHQEKSRTSSAGVFKGGLAGTDYGYAKYHTATHLLLAALRKHFGEGVLQRGSNITLERMRFDFSFDRKLTPEEILLIENEVNTNIQRQIPVICEEMTLDEARKRGAMGIFENKYGDKVTVYTIGDVSKEICGGPHAQNTKDLGYFKITKEESSSSGVRRIKAILTD